MTPGNFPSAPPIAATVVVPATHDVLGMPVDLAETAAAAAALVVDSVVEDTVAAVITNNSLPCLSNAHTTTGYFDVAEPAPVSTIALSVHSEATPTTASAAIVVNVNTNTNLQPQQQAQPQTPSETVRSQPPTIAPAATKATETFIIAPSDTAAKNSKSTAQTYGSLQKSKRRERLEQNRISARESRKRKKSMIEELQRTVIGLTSENKELNGRNQSLRANLAEIGRKHPNSPSIQAILNGMPTPSTQQQQQQQQARTVSNSVAMNGPTITTNFFPQQLMNEGVPVVPMVAPGATPPIMVPYMYIPQAMQTPGGLVQIVAQAVPRGQPVVMPTPAQAPSPVPVVGAPLPVATPQPLTAAIRAQQPQLQQQQHIVIAPQPAPPPMFPIQGGSRAHILPTPASTMLPTVQATIPAGVSVTVPAPIAPVAPFVSSTTATTPTLAASSMMLAVPNPMAAAESIHTTKQDYV